MEDFRSDMDYYSHEIAKLIEELSALPGIGAKSAQRLAEETQAVRGEEGWVGSHHFLTHLRILSNFNLFRSISCAFFLVVLY